jgi:hypothetical protein
MRPSRSCRRRPWWAGLALSTAMLAGCVVTPYGPYYRPSVDHPAAVLKGAWCQGVAGPKTALVLPLAPGVDLTARAQRQYAERDRRELPLRIELTLPAGQPARFAGDTLRVIELGSGKPLGSAPEVTVHRSATLAADGWVDPVRLRPSGAAGTPVQDDAPHGRATLRVDVEPGFTPGRLQLDGVVLARDDGAVKMPPVTMSRPASRASLRDYRSAAWHAALEQQAAACRRDTPQRACDNIVDHSSVSFALAEPAARWSGRWFVFGDGAAAHVTGDIAYAPVTPGRWRLASGVVTVRDGAGEVRAAKVREVRIAFADRIALDTPLFAGPVAGSGDARITIEVLLPGDAPDFEVRLPDLLLDTQRVAIPPIRFDRRTFDGGIEPFNC